MVRWPSCTGWRIRSPAGASLYRKGMPLPLKLRLEAVEAHGVQALLPGSLSQVVPFLHPSLPLPAFHLTGAKMCMLPSSAMPPSDSSLHSYRKLCALDPMEKVPTLQDQHLCAVYPWQS